MKYMSKRRYHRALDELQRLVIQRLFELHKLNMARTGYRMRVHIAKSLKSRCTAIQNAIKAYNHAAAALVPPAPALTWEEASHYEFLEDFELLKDTRQDMQDRPWAQSVVRDAVRRWQRIQRAQEEIIRCNVEVSRLHAAIRDESEHFDKVEEDLAAACSSGEPHLLGAVTDFCARRRRVHELLLTRIYRTYDLEGFTGSRVPGIRKGMSSDIQTEGAMAAAVRGHVERDEDESDESADEDERLERVGQVVDFVTSLPT